MTSNADIEATVLAVLQRLGLPYELIRIDPDFADTAEFCQKYDFSMDCSGNTIIVASKRGEKKFSACIVKASRRLDVNKTVRNLMGVSRASFASAEETMELTGMMIGGVTPFALPGDVPVYVDDTLMGEAYVILGSGSRSSKLKVPPEVLRQIPNSQIISGLSMPPRPQD
jgi:prolyl-tRNA editing enzyme YbaK/EbsC (Cys-tRNA(Pro) deacylase)